MQQNPIEQKNQIIGLSIGLIVLFIGLVGWFIYTPSKDDRFANFEKLVTKANHKELDLSQWNDFDWDELTYWPPYGDICDLKITGFDKGGPHCESSEDDSESYLLFLNKNQLVTKIPINRIELDLASSEIPWRVKKNNAVFVYQDEMPESHTVSLKSQASAKPDLSKEKMPQSGVSDDDLEE